MAEAAATTAGGTGADSASGRNPWPWAVAGCEIRTHRTLFAQDQLGDELRRKNFDRAYSLQHQDGVGEMRRSGRASLIMECADFLESLVGLMSVSPLPTLPRSRIPS